MKHNYSILVLLAGIMFIHAFAQPRIKAQKTIGGDSVDVLTSIDLTTDGGLIAGGYSNSDSSGEKTERSRGSFDYWIVKLDNKGHIQWDKALGGSALDELKSVRQTRDGSYILGGWSESDSSGDKTENSRGNFDSDFWIVKLDSRGNILWEKTIGGNSGDRLSSMYLTKDGGFIAGGYSVSNKSGEKTQDNRGPLFTSDYWVVKFDSLGNIQWDKTIGGNSDDLLNSIQQTNDGGYILGGSSYSDSSGEKTEKNRGIGRDYWVVKLDSLGNIQWDKTIGGNSYDNLNAVQQTADLGYILGGGSWSDSSGEKTEGRRDVLGISDYWVVKLDSLGNIQWDKTIGGNDDDELNSLQQTKDRGYILGGTSKSDSSGEKTEMNRGRFGEADYWVVKLDSLHNIQWDKTIGGNDAEFLADIIERKENRYVVGGNSFSGVSQNKHDTSRGEDDFWIMSLVYNADSSASNSISSYKYSFIVPDSKRTKEFRVYPNPAKDVLYVQTNGKALVSLADQSGRVLLVQTIDGNGTIKVANIPGGLYYLKNNTTGTTQKVIISK